jgi:hypothetical protein
MTGGLDNSTLQRLPILFALKENIQLGCHLYLPMPPVE